MNKLHTIRKFLWRIGFDLHAFEPISSPIARKRILFNKYNVDLIIDIGANNGHYIDAIRSDLNYTGKVISFEPTQSAFALLQKRIATDKNWDAYNFALGNIIGEEFINISENSESSSFLEISQTHINAAPESKYISKEKIQIKTIDSIFDECFSGYKNIFMKIDTQGFEQNIILGAKNSLPKISTIQLEMSIQPLYKNELPFREMYDLMIGFGYKLVSIETGYLNTNGEMLQMDAIFHKD